MWEIVWIGGCAILGVISIASIVRGTLNDIRLRLHFMGLPMTLSNAFYLRSLEESHAYARAQEQATKDDAIITQEIARLRSHRETEKS